MVSVRRSPASGVGRRRRRVGTPAGRRCHRAGETDFIDSDQVLGQQGLDGLADGVIDQAAVEGFHQLGCGELPHCVPGVHRGDPEPDQGVGFAGPGRSDDRRVVLCS